MEPALQLAPADDTFQQEPCEVFDSLALSFNETVSGITEFIEVAIHTILYVRQIYPADVFVRRKKYDIPVFQSRHPALNEYISGAVKAIGEELMLGNVDRVVVVIQEKKDGVALERYIFSMQNMLQMEMLDGDASVQDAMTSATLEQYFRSFLMKLNMVESQLRRLYLGDDVSFAILLELNDDQSPSDSYSKDSPAWIPVGTQHATSGRSDGTDFHILRTVNTGVINLSLAIQESKETPQRERDADGKGDQPVL